MNGARAKLRWYVRRLRAMSAAEIVHRLHEAIRRRVDRRRGARLIPETQDRGPIPPIPGLREGLAAWAVPPDLLAEWSGLVEQMRSGRFFLLGHRWPSCVAPQRWHLDPVSGRSWPAERYCFDINYRHAEGWGDVKLVWEVNRLQYLQAIAALAFKTGDAGLAGEVLAEIESWIDINPPFKGINWCSGIELALRVVSILVVTTLLGEHLSEGKRAKIWQTLYVHAVWLRRYVSAYSSANNHRTAEGLGLFLIGALLPHYDQALAWKAYGFDLLVETARLQILDDGVGAEQTISYTAVVLEMLLLGHHVGQRTETPMPRDFAERITRGGEYLRWFTDAGGGAPHIGDNDNARVIGAYRLDETYVRSILGSIAGVMQRSDLVPPRLEAHLRQAVFGFAPPPSIGPSGVRRFSQGGYTVGRHRVANREILVAIDHGPLGYLSIAAHGHADALSLWLHIDDQPVLIDAGTFLYHAGGSWRTYFRGTGAHNTLSVEGKDSSVMAGNFNWSRKANATVTGFSEAAEGWSLEACQDGYQAEFATTHRRRVEFNVARPLQVRDWIVGPRARQVEIAFLIHPALTVEADAHGATICRGALPLIRVDGQGPLRCIVAQRDDPDACGWYSETFGVKNPAPRIVFSGTLSPDEKFTTTFQFAFAV